MRGSLIRLLLPLAVMGALLAATAAVASAAIKVDEASALERPVAKQASAPGECASALGLDAPRAAQEEAMRCLVDEAREKRGLPALVASPALTGSAVDKGLDLIRCNEFSHTACGREFHYWIEQAGYLSAECWHVGENLAWGVDRQGTVGSVFRAWMHSPSHRENILGDFEEIGIDLRVGELGGLVGVRVWVQHFGSHCGS